MVTVLDEVRDWLSRYICTVSDDDLDLLALWCAHTHAMPSFYTSPRIEISSPVPGAGKTTCLEHMSRLCHKPVQAAVLSSAALLARMLDKGIRTVLIDEADRSLNPDRDGTGDLLAVINSGYKRGATRPVLVPAKGGEWIEKEMPTYAPVALAGNAPRLPEDTRSRIIRVLLLPDVHGKAEESDWELIEPAAEVLGGRLADWMLSIADELRTVRPPLPPGVTGRFREKWTPLRRVAELAGGRWPASVDRMATDDVLQFEADKQDGLVREAPHVLLLRHVLEVWPDEQTFVPTADLITALLDAHPDSWGDASPIGSRLTAHRLGRMLTNYKINSSREPDGARRRGYVRSAVWSVADRMKLTGNRPVKADEVVEPDEVDELPLQPSTSATLTASSALDEGSDRSVVTLVTDIPAHRSECIRCGSCLDNDVQRVRGTCGPCYVTQRSA